ncbi:MAG: alanine racemase [Verrucomicrobiae bacterium]|nr:alanine racemase [Verrucomicrobiae bacterium]
METLYRCWAEVDLDALRQNLLWIKHTIGKKVKIATVVKADAYGHGLRQIATLMMQSGTDVFGVANLIEAETIRSLAKGWQILMLGACLPEEIKKAVKDDIIATISTASEADLFAREARRQGKIAKIHVKVDTGMGRLGVPWQNAVELVKHILDLNTIELNGIYTHFSSAEDDHEFTQLQKQRFKTVIDNLKNLKIHLPIIHANNSAGIIHESDFHFNMVRPGLLVYGIFPSGKRQIDPAVKKFIKPALSFKCRVSYVKEVPPQTPLSYGKIYTTKKKMKIATLTAGYGDGYLRAGSNVAKVLIGGKRCNIVGRITMDQMLADVSDLQEVKPGDEVVMIGSHGNETIDATEVAGWLGTIPWEVFTCITYRVPRIYKGGHAA